MSSLKSEYDFEIKKNQKKNNKINIYRRNNPNIDCNSKVFSSWKEKDHLLDKIKNEDSIILSKTNKKMTKNNSQILNNKLNFFNTQKVYNPNNRIRKNNRSKYLLPVLNLNDINSIENLNEKCLFTQKEKKKLLKIIPDKYLNIYENKFKTIEEDQKNILSKINLQKTMFKTKLDKLEIGENNVIETIKTNLILHSKFSNCNKKIMELHGKIKLLENEEKLLDINYKKKLSNNKKYEEELNFLKECVKNIKYQKKFKTVSSVSFKKKKNNKAVIKNFSYDKSNSCEGNNILIKEVIIDN